MKKILFFIAFLFSVVCYAAPPPDKPTSFLADDVGIIRSQSDITVQVIEVQEVAFTYIAYALSASNQFNIQSLRKPPMLLSNTGVINLNSVCEINKQHSNYGYPFGADHLFS